MTRNRQNRSQRRESILEVESDSMAFRGGELKNSARVTDDTSRGETMKLVLKLLFVMIALLGIKTAVAQTVVLDDFATFRKSGNTGAMDYCNTTAQDPANYSNCLWPGQPNQGPTICNVPTPGALVCNTNTGPAAQWTGFLDEYSRLRHRELL